MRARFLGFLALALGKQWISEWEQPRWRKLNSEAMELANAGRAQDALALFREAYKQHPSAELLNNIAVSLEQLGKRKEAERTYLRVLNVNANNADTYRMLLKRRGHLSVDVASFVAEQRRKRAERSPSPSPSCAAGGPVPEPPPALPLPHLVNRSNPPTPWGGSTVLVVAHWKETLSWLRQPPFNRYSRVVYQRHDPDAPYYSPNFGFEAGVYLQFIVEHYDALPEQVVFLQADPESHIDMSYLGETLDCLRAGAVRYFSFSKMPFLYGRNLDNYTGVYSPEAVAPFIRTMPACARRLLSFFGVEVEAGTPLQVSTYCCATFTASREAIRRHAWEVWRHAYEVVGCGAAPCVYTADERQGGGPSVTGLADLSEGFVMEHIWHAIFGEPLRSTGHRGDATCQVASCGKYCPDPSAPDLGMFAALR